MASIYRLRQFVVVCFLFLLHSKEGAALTWTVQPTSATGIQGQSVSITWAADLNGGETWTNVRVSQEVAGVVNKQPVIRYSKTSGILVYDAYINRSADLNLTASLSGTLLKTVFTMKNLNRSTDEHLYVLRILFNDNVGDTDSRDSGDLSLKVLVPTVITSPNPKIVTVNESNIARLECTVEGNPTPHVNWTRNGVFLGSGVYNTPAPVEMNDDKTCYTCIAYNGVLDAKTANVCLNVQYKPRNATIESDRSTVCQNGKVNLTCTSDGPANPTPSSYEFYNNGILIGTSASNVYEATATAGLPDVNKFVCVPRNLVGSSLKNGSVEVTAKVAPTVTQTLGSSETVVEGSNVTLACSASGTSPLNVTWTRTGKPDVSGLQYPIIGIKRGDAGLYQCTVNNGAECPPNTAGINVIVNYKPESTNLTYTPSSEKFCQGNQINLTCAAHGKPAAEYSLYRNNQLVQSGSTAGVFNVQLNEKGDNTFTCVPNNTVGAGQNKSIQVFVKEAPLIVTVPQNTNLKEGVTLTLFCNASGLPAPNITWTKVGGSNVGSTETFTISSITRGQEGTYRCTASNGDECSNVTAEANVVVNYPPESTSISTNKSDNTFLKGNIVKLSCASTSKPPLCNVTFYHGNTVIQSYPGKTCAGADAAIHVIQNIDGCNLEEYSCKAENQYGQQEAKINLTINVPATIATSPAADVVLVEGDALQLNCTATGCPTPNVTWTKTGNPTSLASGNGFFLSHGINSLGKSHTGNYKCSVDNGVVGSPVEKTIYVNVTYKPYQTALTTTLSKACLNDAVILNCTSDANPPAHEYHFYLNDQLVHTNMSGVYQLNVPQAGNNTYKCEPKNIVGGGQNATVNIATKAPPKITGSTPDQTAVEGDRVVLMCNVTGSDPMNVTWSKVGGSSYPEGSSYTIASIVRGDEATYQCTAHNGNECPAATATSTVIVNYKPENTSLTASRTTGCVSDSLTLTCNTSAKPARLTYRFFRNDVLIKSHDTKIYTFPMSVSGANVYKCQPENMAGNGTDSNVTVNVKAAPVIDFVTPSQELIEGNSLTLVCNVTDSSGQLNVSWHKVGGDQLSSNSTYTIASVGRNDAGSYQCKAHNGNECDAKTKLVDVTVKYPAAITSQSNLTVKANENDMVTLKCMVSGSPTPKVNWTRNGQQITGKHGQTYSFNAMESLSGNYTCVVSNGVGAVRRKTFDVKITGYCKTHKCRYGGTCISKGVGYRCLCTRGLIGKFCEFEDPITSEFDCLLVIVNPDWVPEYGDKKSSKHNELENKICDKMFRIFNGRPPAIPGRNLVTCALLDTRQGSIISNTLLTFNGSVLRSEVLNAIQDSVVNETIFGNLTLKASSIQVEPKRDPCSSEPCKFDGKCEVQGNGYRCECGSFRYGMHCEKGIGLIPGLIIILACILIIIIIIILCVLYCKRKKSETYPSAGAENGTQMKTYTLSDHNAAAANPHVITADEKPPVRNGQPVETYRQNGKDEVVYADLSFKTFDNKEKKDVEKLPQQSETVYADIVSFQQNTDEKPKQDATLEEEAIELTEKDSNPEPEKENEVGDQDEGSKQTDNVADSQGGDETPENPKTDGYSTSPLVRLV